MNEDGIRRLYAILLKGAPNGPVPERARNYSEMVHGIGEEDFVKKYSDRAELNSFLKEVNTKYPNFFEGSSPQQVLSHLSPLDEQAKAINDVAEAKSAVVIGDMQNKAKAQNKYSQGFAMSSGVGLAPGMPSYATNKKVTAADEIKVKETFRGEEITKNIPFGSATAEEEYALRSPERLAQANREAALVNKEVKKKYGVDVNPYQIVYGPTNAQKSMTADEVLKADKIEGIDDEGLLHVKRTVFQDKLLLAEQHRNALNAYEERANAAYEKYYTPEINDALTKVQDVMDKQANKEEVTPQEMADAQSAQKMLDALPEETKKAISNIGNGLLELQDKRAALDAEYPELRIVEALNNRIQAKKDVNAQGLETAAKAAGFPAQAAVSVWKVLRGAAEIVPRGGEELASTYNAIAAIGSDDAKARLIRRAHRDVLPGTFRDSTKEMRPALEQTATMQDGDSGKMFEIGYDSDGHVTNIYDGNGYQARLTDDHYRSILQQAEDMDLKGLAKTKLNGSAAFNQVIDGTADLAVTFALAKGLGSLGKFGKLGKFLEGASGASMRAREAMPIFFQFSGKMAEQGIKEGLSPEAAITYGIMGAAAEAVTEMASPFIGQFTGVKQLALRETLERIAADPLELKRIAKNAFRSGAILGPLGEGAEEVGSQFLQPITNKAINALFDSQLDEDQSSWQDYATSFGLGALVSALPGVIGGISNSRRVASDDFLQESIYNSVLQAEKVAEASARFNDPKINRINDIIQETQARSKDLIEDESIPQRAKVKLIGMQFDAVKREMDLQDAKGTASEKKVADDLAQRQTDLDNARASVQMPETDDRPIKSRVRANSNGKISTKSWTGLRPGDQVQVQKIDVTPQGVFPKNELEPAEVDYVDPGGEFIQLKGQGEGNNGRRIYADGVENVFMPEETEPEEGAGGIPAEGQATPGTESAESISQREIQAKREDLERRRKDELAAPSPGTTPDMINEKYDAELAAIENPVQEVKKVADKKTGFTEAGLKSKETKDATHLGRWLLDNSEEGDVIETEGGGYEVTTVTTKKDGTKEVVLTPFELNEDGTKDYNNSGVKLISEQSIKNASSVFEESYTDNTGNRVTKQSTYKPVSLVPEQSEKTPSNTTVYHGGNLDSPGGLIYATKDKRQATAYAEGNGGKVNEFTVDEGTLATEEEVRATINELGLKSRAEGWDMNELGVHELIDPRFDTALPDSDIEKLVNALKEKGKTGITFRDEDLLQENKAGVESIAIFDSEKIVKPVSSQSEKEQSDVPKQRPTTPEPESPAAVTPERNGDTKRDTTSDTSSDVPEATPGTRTETKPEGKATPSAPAVEAAPPKKPLTRTEKIKQALTVAVGTDARRMAMRFLLENKISRDIITELYAGKMELDKNGRPKKRTEEVKARAEIIDAQKRGGKISDLGDEMWAQMGSPEEVSGQDLANALAEILQEFVPIGKVGIREQIADALNNPHNVKSDIAERLNAKFGGGFDETADPEMLAQYERELDNLDPNSKEYADLLASAVDKLGEQELIARAKAEEALTTPPTKTVTKKGVTVTIPVNLRDQLEAKLKDVFKLDKAQAVVAARVIDRLFQTMADREEIPVHLIYDAVDFVKGDLVDAQRLVAQAGLPQEKAERIAGAQWVKDGKAIVGAFMNPNISTPIHEVAHVFEKYLTPQERADIMKAGGYTKWEVGTSEYFARGFERYLAEGVAPTPDLQPIFDKMKQFMLDIYHSIAGSPIDVQLTPAVRQVFARMLGHEVPPILGPSQAAPSLTTVEQVGDWLLADTNLPLFQDNSPVPAQPITLGDVKMRKGKDFDYDGTYEVIYNKQVIGEMAFDKGFTNQWHDRSGTVDTRIGGVNGSLGIGFNRKEALEYFVEKFNNKVVKEEGEKFRKPGVRQLSIFDIPQNTEVETGDGKKEKVEFNSTNNSGEYPKQEASDKNIRTVSEGWEESKLLQFTGNISIKGPADVAHIMRLLEDKAVEHFFAVHQDAEGMTHIQHVSIGSVNAAVVDPRQILAGVTRFNTKKLYLVHNHPSGKVDPSPQDINLTDKIIRGLQPLGIDVEHIIMDTYTQEYALFSYGGRFKTLKRDTEPLDKSKEYIYTPQTFHGIKVLSEPLAKITSTEDAAGFVYGLRFSAVPKAGAMILNQRNHVIGNYVFTDGLNHEELLKEFSLYPTATSLIMYGNQPVNDNLRASIAMAKDLDIKVLDYINVKGGKADVRGAYESAADAGLINEVESKYGTNILAQDADAKYRGGAQGDLFGRGVQPDLFGNANAENTSLQREKASPEALLKQKYFDLGYPAPNGKKSNLTPEQYAQVRTPEFKKWFGDWENPVTFSAYNVVDEQALKAKYPPVHPNLFYHHSTNEFNPKGVPELGKETSLKITGRLTTDKVDVLLVENPGSKNKYPHITLSTAEGVKPFESNKEIESNLSKIVPIEDSVNVVGTNNLKSDVSKVVDENGEPLVVYHGSHFGDFSVFDNSKASDKKPWTADSIFYFSPSKRDAREYASSGKVFDVFLNFKNPLKWGNEGYVYRDGSGELKNISSFTDITDDQKKQLEKDGYDGVDATKRIGVISHTGEYLAFSPTQIKSATDNKGTFDADNPNILFQESPEKVEPDYGKWKRKNVTYRGIKQMGKDNGVAGIFGDGLYTAPSSNKAMAKEYGKVYFVVNGRPKNPKVFDSLNAWEIWMQQNLLPKNENGFPSKRLFGAQGKTIEGEMQKLGYDGVEIKGREIVNYTPKDVAYYETERGVQGHHEDLLRWEAMDKESTPLFQDNTPTKPLAPNGQPSKLTPAQHAQVRTPEFKAWFGDWENDPASASKVVDENGEPLVVYHGTLAGFDEFKHGKSYGSGDDQLYFGKGFYFTNDKRTADSYSKGRGTTMSLFLNVKNPIVSTEKLHSSPWGGDAFKRDNLLKGTDAEVQAQLKQRGYDGVAHYSGEENWTDGFGQHDVEYQEYAVFNPNQIKSATDNKGTFDADNNNILFQESNEIKVYHGTSELKDAFEGNEFFTDSKKDASAYAEFKVLEQAISEDPELESLVNEILSEYNMDAIQDMTPQQIHDIIVDNGFDLKPIEGKRKLMSANISYSKPADLRPLGHAVTNIKDTWEALHGAGLVEESWKDLDTDIKQELKEDYQGSAIYKLFEKEDIYNKLFDKGYDAVIFTDQSPSGKSTHNSFLVKGKNQVNEEGSVLFQDPGNTKEKIMNRLRSAVDQITKQGITAEAIYNSKKAELDAAGVTIDDINGVLMAHIRPDREMPIDQVRNTINTPVADDILDYDMTTSDETNKMLSGATWKSVFGETPEGEQMYFVQKLNDMLDDGKRMIAMASRRWGAAVMDYAPPLFDLIKQMPDGMSNKKAVLLATLLGELQEQKLSNPSNKKVVARMENQVLAYYQHYMNIQGKRVAAGRLLRIYRDRYLSEVYEDMILEEADIRKRRAVEKAMTMPVTDPGTRQETITEAEKKTQDEAAQKRTDLDKMATKQKRKSSNTVAQTRAQVKATEILSKTGLPSMESFMNRLRDSSKNIKCP